MCLFPCFLQYLHIDRFLLSLKSDHTKVSIPPSNIQIPHKLGTRDCHFKHTTASEIKYVKSSCKRIDNFWCWPGFGGSRRAYLTVTHITFVVVRVTPSHLTDQIWEETDWSNANITVWLFLFVIYTSLCQQDHIHWAGGNMLWALSWAPVAFWPASDVTFE